MHMPYKNIEQRRAWQRNNSSRRNKSAKRIEWKKSYVCRGGKQKAQSKWYYSPKGINYIMKYRQDNKTSIKKSTRLWGLSLNGKYSNYKKNSKARGIIFEITLEDFSKFWNVPCSYCGELISTVGVDRIDNSKGYILDNIISCCSTCNSMKGKLSKEQFIIKCKEISLMDDIFHK